jgi:hypothetical protein
MGSSPVRMGDRKGKGKERDLNAEVLGFARRAKGLGAEIRKMDGDSRVKDVDGMMVKVEALAEDMVSVKTVAGIKVGYRMHTSDPNNEWFPDLPWRTEYSIGCVSSDSTDYTTNRDSETGSREIQAGSAGTTKANTT